MDNSFLKEQADRCRGLAQTADQFTKGRLLDLAKRYEERLERPSLATGSLAPNRLLEARLEDQRKHR
jgi:hypothetical protein